MTLPACPKCGENMTYDDGTMYVCPMCFHEWTEQSMIDAAQASIIRDVNGNELVNGDSVSIVKDLKLGNATIKQGTKVKNIRTLEEKHEGHDLLAKVDGFGEVYLKGSVVKKI